MSLPTPRPPDEDTVDDPGRARFLAVCGALYDRLREGSRAQADHAAAMAERNLGGTLYLHLPSRAAKRDLPEAGYISDPAPGLVVTRSMLP
jgi:hypothetical protein